LTLLDKVYNFQIDESAEDSRHIHRLIKKIGDDILDIKFNTAIAVFMGFLGENKSLNKKDWETFLKLLAPFAPHIAEEIWQEVLKNTESIHLQPWPEYDPSLIKDEKVRIIIQINGKVRDTIEVDSGLGEDKIKDLALASSNVQKHLAGEKPQKVVYIKDRLINFVI